MRMKYSLEYTQQIARQRGGVCLSAQYVDFRSKLKWKCREGHVWEGRLENILRGRWCSVCREQKKEADRLQKARQLTTSRGGECLSDEYAPGEKLLWRGKNGHLWRAKPNSILSRATWRPECYYPSLCRHDEARGKYLPTNHLP
ncbi:MAG: hypothetical protein LBF51_07000 [Zoogloeaceae bacterium]|jgi:hypothetical protein|nr:hypothetical protein [Zoogloeaceae bacterium]